MAKNKRKRNPKTVFKLPDLEQSKSPVLNSLTSWLTAEQGKRLLAGFNQSSIRGKRDYAMVAILLGCGLRRAEVAGLAFENSSNEKSIG